MKILLFPGQGSQKKGMGGALFNDYKFVTEEADAILGYSIAQLCLVDPDGRLNLTEFTQPALFVTNALSYYRYLDNGNPVPDLAAGHSLGEYNALLAAGVLSFGSALKLVQARGRIMAEAKGGSMAAVVGIPAGEIEASLLKAGLTGVDIAAYNAPSQIVLSGLEADLRKCRTLFETGFPRAFLPLAVSGAFHSRYMESARTLLTPILDACEFMAPRFPIVSNVLAKPHWVGESRRLLLDQLTHPVRWTESMQYAFSKGIENAIEIGPGRVLSNLFQKSKASFDTALRPIPVCTSEPMQSANLQDGLSLDSTALGDQEFKLDYGLRFAYVAGPMYRGISSEEMVIRLGQAGLMGYFGTAGLEMDRVHKAIMAIQAGLRPGMAFGMNLLCNLAEPWIEEETVEAFLSHGIRNIQVSAYMSMTPYLVLLRIKGITKDSNGMVRTRTRIQAKLSRPEVAAAFLAPAPASMIAALVSKGKLSVVEGELAMEISMADDIVVEADSGGHTDRRNPLTLFTSIRELRDEMQRKYGYPKKVRLGAGGGIGTPEAAAASFIMGADFILTGSINQCSVEAGTSDLVKDMLSGMNIHDTEYAPAGDLFELGSKVQVFRKGVLFPARANKLYDIYRTHQSLESIDEHTRNQIENRYFGRSFKKVYEDIRQYYLVKRPKEIEKAEANPKHKMALVFKWYFAHSSRIAMAGDPDRVADFQIHCGPALGAFNQMVKGSPLENWKNRHVDGIAEKIMFGAAEILSQRFATWWPKASAVKNSNVLNNGPESRKPQPEAIS